MKSSWEKDGLLTAAFHCSLLESVSKNIVSIIPFTQTHHSKGHWVDMIRPMQTCTEVLYWQPIRATSQWSAFELQKCVALVLDQSKFLACWLLAGKTLSGTRQLASFAGFLQTRQHHSPGLHFVSRNLLLHSDILLSITKYSHWYRTVCVWYISCFNHHNEQRHIPYNILKIRVNRAPMIVGHISWVIHGGTGCTQS